MFTGIVEELGSVLGVERSADSARLWISGPLVTEDARPGDSIAVSGVCLTVTALNDGAFSADVMAETLSRSSLNQLTPGATVNLERPVTLQTRMGGHLVQGHVDGVGKILARTNEENWEVIRISLPDALARYVVVKGSITVDGVSLTVSSLDASSFEVSLIPTTLAMTTLGSSAVGAAVNLEVDVIAKYVERMMTVDVDGTANGGSEGA